MSDIIVPAEKCKVRTKTLCKYTECRTQCWLKTKLVVLAELLVVISTALFYININRSLELGVPNVSTYYFYDVIVFVSDVFLQNSVLYLLLGKDFSHTLLDVLYNGKGLEQGETKLGEPLQHGDKLFKIQTW